jgi:hypothetical protein
MATANPETATPVVVKTSSAGLYIALAAAGAGGVVAVGLALKFGLVARLKQYLLGSALGGATDQIQQDVGGLLQGVHYLLPTTWIKGVVDDANRIKKGAHAHDTPLAQRFKSEDLHKVPTADQLRALVVRINPTALALNVQHSVDGTAVTNANFTGVRTNLWGYLVQDASRWSAASMDQASVATYLSSILNMPQYDLTHATRRFEGGDIVIEGVFIGAP